MNPGVRRRTADLACRALQVALPPSLRSWGWAVRCETAGIPEDTKALLFALDSLCGLLPRATAIRLCALFALLTGDDVPHSKGLVVMSSFTSAVRRPLTVGIACSIGAVFLGFVYMAIAGAPLRYLAINAGALAVGLIMLIVAARAGRKGAGWSSGLIAAMSAALLGTALLGHSADGATRWLMIGGLALQPSLILLPVMVMTFARSSTVLGTVGMLVAAAALALQPDRAMTGMLAAGLATLAMLRADRFVATALAASIVGFIVTLMRPDTLPAAPFVDQILYSAFDVHALAGVAVALGAVLLLLPAILGRIYDAANLEIYLVFGALWVAAVAAAALGNYPTPIVGYGGSAIIGYVLSLAALPKRATAQPRMEARSLGGADVEPGDHHMRLGLA